MALHSLCCAVGTVCLHWSGPFPQDAGSLCLCVSVGCGGVVEPETYPLLLGTQSLIYSRDHETIDRVMQVLGQSRQYAWKGRTV